MSNTVQFTINCNGNADVYTKNMIRATGELKGKFDTLNTAFGKFKANLIVFNAAMAFACYKVKLSDEESLRYFEQVIEFSM